MSLVVICVFKGMYFTIIKISFDLSSLKVPNYLLHLLVYTLPRATETSINLWALAQSVNIG